MTSGVAQRAALTRFQTLHRPADLHIPLEAASETDAYWTILSAAATLGMITSRGLPASYRPQTALTQAAA